MLDGCLTGQEPTSPQECGMNVTCCRLGDMDKRHGWRQPDGNCKQKRTAVLQLVVMQSIEKNRWSSRPEKTRRKDHLRFIMVLQSTIYKNKVLHSMQLYAGRISISPISARSHRSAVVPPTHPIRFVVQNSYWPVYLLGIRTYLKRYPIWTQKNRYGYGLMLWGAHTSL